MRARLITIITAVSAAVTGCGSGNVQRSNTPANVNVPAAPGGSAPAIRKVSGQFIGEDVPTQFGDIQVEIILKKGRITDVGWLKLPFDRPRSQLISEQAAPILRSEVLTAQSASINLLSGATYTSDAWATSVQAALNQVR